MLNSTLFLVYFSSFRYHNLVYFNWVDHLQRPYIAHWNLANCIQGLSQPLEFTRVLQWVHFIYTPKMQFSYCNLDVVSMDSLNSINKWKNNEKKYRWLWFLSLQSITRKYHTDTDESNIQSLKDINPHFKNTIASTDSVHESLRRMPVGSFYFLDLFTYKLLRNLCLGYVPIWSIFLINEI